MILLATVRTWLIAELATQGVTTPVQINWLPETPDEIIVATASGGTLPTVDGAFETSHVHVRCRGPKGQGSDDAAEQNALAVHRALSPLRLGGAFTMGSTHVLSVLPMAPPAFLMRDLSQRAVYMASYLLEAPAPS